jgi:hypothetical protein
MNVNEINVSGEINVSERQMDRQNFNRFAPVLHLQQ